MYYSFIIFSLHLQLETIEYSFEDVDIYPTICLHSPEECVRAVFNIESFKYDIKSYVQKYEMEREIILNKISLSSCAILPMVKEYLVANGFMETLEKLSASDYCDLDKRKETSLEADEKKDKKQSQEKNRVG